MNSKDKLEILASLYVVSLPRLDRANDAPPQAVAVLEERLEDCIGSEDYVKVIRALVATRDPAAIRVLASLLDSVGPIAKAAIKGLLEFGEAVVPAMRECIDSLDYDMIRHGHQVLAALGDEASKQWLRDDRRDRFADVFERMHLSELAARDAVANESEDPNEVA